MVRPVIEQVAAVGCLGRMCDRLKRSWKDDAVCWCLKFLTTSATYQAETAPQLNAEVAVFRLLSPRVSLALVEGPSATVFADDRGDLVVAYLSGVRVHNHGCAEGSHPFYPYLYRGNGCRVVGQTRNVRRIHDVEDRRPLGLHDRCGRASAATVHRHGCEAEHHGRS